MKKITRKTLTLFLAIIFALCIALPSFAATQNQLKQSAYGFMEYVGCEDGMELLKHSKETRLGKKGDASNFENMFLALKLLDATNQYRAQEGAAALKVTYYFIAYAITNANWSVLTHEHAGSILGGEVLAFGARTPEDASKMWYNEKATYLQHPEWATSGTSEQKNQVGHYVNMVNPKYKITGAAVCTRDGYTWTWAQEFRNPDQQFKHKNDNDPRYTVNQVRQKLQEYINQVGNYDENDTSPETPFRLFDDETPVGAANGNEWYCMKSDLALPNNVMDTTIKHIYYDNDNNLVLEMAFKNGTDHDLSLTGLYNIDIQSKADQKQLVKYSGEVRLDQKMTVSPKNIEDFTIKLSPEQQIAQGDLTQGIISNYAHLYD